MRRHFVEVNHAAAALRLLTSVRGKLVGVAKTVALTDAISWSTTVAFEESLQEMLDFQPSSGAHQSCAEVD